MGRHPKTIFTGDGLDRRRNGYYATPDFVADFISSEMMRINPAGRTVLDPCVGKEELLGGFAAAGKSIHSFDIEDFGVHRLATFERTDFLEFYRLRQAAPGGQNPNLPYDYYIANPPYNCHEAEVIRSNKSELRAAFRKIGTFNMYSMFLSAIINLAKRGSLIGVITFDSFLTAVYHKHLRLQILRSCRIHDIILCPVDLFRDQRADVRTCIIILEKGPPSGTDYEIKVLNRPRSLAEFRELLTRGAIERQTLKDVLLIGNYDSHGFVIGCPAEIRRLFDLPRLGNEFRCVTGISTGNDKKYILKEKTAEFDIPFYKNPGTSRFYKEPDGYLRGDFLDVEKKVKNFMVRNKDSLFREGISCSSMGIPFGACYLPPGGAFGVNANIFCGHEDIWWLLSYLNSSLVIYLTRGIIVRTNMITSGYVSRIPVVRFTASDRNRLARLSKTAYENHARREEYPAIIKEIDKIVYGRLNLSDTTVRTIETFCADLLRLT